MRLQEELASERDDLTERHTLSFFFSLSSSFSRSLGLGHFFSYSLIARPFRIMEAAACTLHPHNTTFCNDSEKDTTMYSDSTSSSTSEAVTTQNTSTSVHNPDYMNLALKQWSVYLGNVLLNFIHKECKNNNVMKKSYCASCHYNNSIQQHYINYANYFQNYHVIIHYQPERAKRAQTPCDIFVFMCPPRPTKSY